VSKKPAKPRSRSVFRAIGAPFLFFRRLLRCRVTLKREGKNLNVVLVPDEPDAPVQESVDKDAEALRLLRADLKSLLDAHPMTRRMVARHLAAFERALAKHGMNALNRVPIDVLVPALAQLEALVSNWSSPSLASLRSEMSVTLINRSNDPFHGHRGETPSAFTDSSLLVAEVSEVSESMFMEFAEQYENQPAAQAPQESLSPISLDFAPSGSPADTLEHKGRALRT
jgi:hypothetical protein